MKASREHQAEKSGISSRIGYHRLVRVGPRHLGSHHHRRPPIQGKEGVVDKPIRDGFDKSWEGYSLPAKYLLMVEFESLAMAQGSMPYVNVKPEILFVHGPKVLNNCIQVPSVRISETMFKDHNYREVL
jgi:sulfur oxygenase/reductase